MLKKPSNIRLRRGARTATELITYAVGEPVYTTDEKKLYIGDGVTPGGVVVSGGVGAIGMLDFEDATELTISSGEITVTQSFHNVDTESNAASDDLDTISGGDEGNFIILTANTTGRITVIRNNGGGTGNILTYDGADFRLENTSTVALLIFNGTNWIVMNRGNLVIKPVPDADLTGNGITFWGKAHENLTAGQVCFLNASSEYAKIDANAAATMPVVAMAMESISANATGKFLAQGFFRNDAWNWTVGGILYAATSAGGMQQAAPTGAADIVQSVGYAYSADVAYFNPNLTTVEIA